jgi:hypothetical protein
MAFEERLDVEINTLFNSTGFRQLNQRLERLQDKFQATLGQAQQLAAVQRRTEKLGDALQQAGLTETGNSISAPFRDLDTGSLVSAREGTERLATALNEIRSGDAVVGIEGVRNELDRIRNNPVDPFLQDARQMNLPQSPDLGLAESFQESVRQVENLRSELGAMDNQATNPALQQAAQTDTPGSAGSSRQFERRNIFGQSVQVARDASMLAGVQAALSQRFGNSIGKVQGFTSSLRAAVPAARDLRLRLLNLQFGLLTVAFIFGGLAAGALSAVGVFERLGNVLEFFFLPSAIGLLDPLSKLEDFIFSLDEETRKFFGDIALGIAAVTLFGSILAALAIPLTSVLSFIKTLGGAILSLGSILSGTSIAGTIGAKLGTFLSTMKVIAAGFGVKGVLIAIKGALASLAVAFAPILLKIGLVVGAFLLLLEILNRFPGLKEDVVQTLKSIATVLTTGIGTAVALVVDRIQLFFEQVTSIFGGIINIITGVFTLLIAALKGDTDKFVKAFDEIIKGLEQVFIMPFVNLINFLKNDVLNEFVKFSKTLVKEVLKVFKENQGLVIDAIGAALGVGGDSLRTALNSFGLNKQERNRTIDDMISQVESVKINNDKFESPGFGKDFKRNSTAEGSQAGFSVQNVMQNLSVNFNDDKGSYKKKGEEFGRGLTKGMRNRQSNFKTGT